MRFICSIHASGYSLACSTSRTVGFTSRSTNARTVSTSMVSSSVICTAILTPYACNASISTVSLYGHIVGGPYFDDLEVGQVFDTAPSMTLTEGAAAAHQSIIGDRLRLALDTQLAYAVTGATTALAHPALVCD